MQNNAVLDKKPIMAFYCLYIKHRGNILRSNNILNKLNTILYNKEAL